MRIEIKNAGNSSNFLHFLVEATGFESVAKSNDSLFIKEFRGLFPIVPQKSNQ